MAAALWQCTAAELVQGYRQGAFTPLDALQACLERSEVVNAQLNALVAWDREGAREAAQASTARWRAGQPLSALDGVPVTIKDNIHVQGLPTHWGSQALRGLVPTQDEEPVARLRAAGALIFGKTNVPEFTMQGYTDNQVFGATGNPWSLALTPGGSSGGAAALVAAGGCPLALGTDGGGSIRRPASHTNLVGLKPSRGRVPRGHGLPPIFLDFEVAGPLARSVGDARAMMQVIGPAPDAQPLASTPARVLYIPRFFGHPVDPAIAGLTDAAAEHLAALGHTVRVAQDFRLAEAVSQRWPQLSQVGLAWLVAHPEALWAQPFDPARFGPDMQASARLGEAMPATQLFDLLMEIEHLRRGLEDLFAECDVLLTPAAAALPWPATQSHPPTIDGQAVGPRGHAVFTGFVNAAGLPGIALPCGFAGELPVGLQLVARHGGDDALLALAAQWEQAHPWRRFPALG